MKRGKRSLSFFLAILLIAALCVIPASAKTNPAGQTVGTVLFYIVNRAGEEILAAHIPVSEMEADMQAGLIDDTNHNYSVLDRYVTPVHQEAQGFTAAEFVAYAQSKSTVPAIREAALTFAGEDRLSFWEIDQAGYDELDTYTWNDLYGVPRYNFPLLYEYWNYRTQDYYDPAGKMSREEVIDYIFDHGEPEIFLISVRAFSQRYQSTGEKYSASDFNMEDYWLSCRLPDNERALRMMVPMSEQELREMASTASNSRYWCANIRLSMASPPDIAAQGRVAAPTAVMTEDGENYYIDFQCATPGATILYNQNYLSLNYTPTCEYTGRAAVVPKAWFPEGEVTVTCRAVRDGWTDEGVVTLTLKPTGTYRWHNPYADVPEDKWYSSAVAYADRKLLFDPTGRDADGRDLFSPEAPMTRGMLALALYRLSDSPRTSGIASTPFLDVAPTSKYAAAIAWCYANNVVNGTGDTTFDPDATITREQIVTMFCRYAEKVAGADMTPADDLSRFTDRETVSAWALPGLQWAVAAGLINGMTEDTIAPKGTATRAQTAALLQRLADWMA
ncbi:MAG: S-layer homology domain-containing protein [Bacteroidales bacterium]|nr:S-layer homology domain-containing protein [Bacteroidales bacterium]